uniref:Mediator complex subunit 4 n=1 Tax=Aegilops tauschii subsp. strangulata TaxID=200361 RepID=A0A453LH92_AEGTS
MLTSHIITLLSAAWEANTVSKFGFHSTWKTSPSWLSKACKLLDSFRKSNSLIVPSPDAVAKIHSLNGLKDREFT